MTLSELQRVKELELENARLKRLVADLSLDNQILKEVNSKSGNVLPEGAMLNLCARSLSRVKPC